MKLDSTELCGTGYNPCQVPTPATCARFRFHVTVYWANKIHKPRWAKYSHYPVRLNHPWIELTIAYFRRIFSEFSELIFRIFLESPFCNCVFQKNKEPAHMHFFIEKAAHVHNGLKFCCPALKPMEAQPGQVQSRRTRVSPPLHPLYKWKKST